MTYRSFHFSENVLNYLSVRKTLSREFPNDKLNLRSLLTKKKN